MSVRRGSPLPVQGTLMGIAAAPEAGSLFLGVFPPAAACEAIALETDALRIEHSLTGMPIKSDRLHATLHYLGEHAIERNDIVDKASVAASRVGHAGFDMVLARASSFSSRSDRHPCVLLCPEDRPPIHGLWRELGNQLMAAGLGRYLKREFIPHVTVLYDTRVVTPQAIEPVRWEVRDFSLVRSQAGRSDYEILASWPLRSG
ncbi:MAG: 2'-5' RNA ligase family protein [Pseudoxanthomonas sp.]